MADKWRICSECGDKLHIMEFRHLKRRVDDKHLICIECEPDVKKLTKKEVAAVGRKVTAGKVVVTPKPRIKSKRIRLVPKPKKTVKVKGKRRVRHAANVLEHGLSRNEFTVKHQSLEVLVEHFQMIMELSVEIGASLENYVSTKKKYEKLYLTMVNKNESLTKILKDIIKYKKGE